MPEETPRAHWDEKPEGLPWQVVYASFIGVLICVLGFYLGLSVMGAAEGTPGRSAGLAIIVASAALAACFAAMLTGASWALSVARVATMAEMAAMLARLAWEMVEASRAPEWQLPNARLWSLTVDALFQPRALMLLAGLAACAFLLCLLLGPVVRRFFGRK
jgi:hypothetical protein